MSKKKRPPLLQLHKPPPLRLEEPDEPVNPANTKPILQTIKPGGSGTGISYYSTYVECPEMARLNEQSARNYGPTTFDTDATAAGTVFHALLELYYRKREQFPTNAVQFQQINGTALDVDERARLEGERLFKAYRKQFPPDEFGTPVAIEELLPRNKQQAAAVEAEVGIAPFTMKCDLVVKLNKRICQRVIAQRHIDVTPGYYMVDHKTQGSFRSNTVDYYKGSLQFIAYQLAWNAAHPDKPLNGLISNIAIKKKQPEFLSILVEPPSKAEQQILHQYFAGVVHIMETMPEWKNANACYKFGTCLWYQTGDCLRY